MKVSIFATIMAAAGMAVATGAIRPVSEVLPTLKQDPSGLGFTHVGSDNVVRTFNRDFGVVDFAQLDDKAPTADGWPRIPSPDVLAEAKEAHARSSRLVSRARPLGPLGARDQKSCVSRFCPDDQYCKGLSAYGYSCGSCMVVSNNVGNCQPF
ncbi:hypothetical protein GGS23DRAFT_594960 [Durotheca rogersii]|uniref:uncharacterized protein n=1 Tax=Durotheca rogersii TaxID=419775 RepID=UPI00221FCC63|nr:uncharacterized protein GGS23DRAFT_594960 [Durotheca rogersii]KAI5865434.1 hypothetical protein GGS23DRAFT_594960 [Durotheca rogersii]